MKNYTIAIAFAAILGAFAYIGSTVDAAPYSDPKAFRYSNVTFKNGSVRTVSKTATRVMRLTLPQNGADHIVVRCVARSRDTNTDAGVTTGDTAAAILQVGIKMTNGSAAVYANLTSSAYTGNDTAFNSLIGALNVTSYSVTGNYFDIKVPGADYDVVDWACSVVQETPVQQGRN